MPPFDGTYDPNDNGDYAEYEQFQDENGTFDADYTYDHDSDLTPFDPKSVCDIIGICDGCGEVSNVNAYHYCEYCWDDLEE